jgi:sec-independent protein translocase protein TatB
MFDMSWGEVMVIGAVALIVIGPKDLPKALRTLGNMTAKVRRMASEFQSQFNDAMREAELDEIRKQVEGVNQSVADFNPIQTVRDELKGAIEGPVPSGTAAANADPLAQPEPPVAALPPVPEPAAPLPLEPPAVPPAPVREPEAIEAAPAGVRPGEGRA